MTERPILFQGAMVRALLAGTKLQTRRVVKMKPHHQIEQRDDGKNWPWMYDGDRDADSWMACPYGQPGDRLWVREAWAKTQPLGLPWPQTMIVYREGDNRTDYGGPWKPSIHMPRVASRITLEVTGVRVERLQDISEADAIAEGVEDVTAMVAPRDREFRFWRRYRDGGFNTYTDNAVASYASLWTQINGPGSWEADPWVWVVQFRVAEPTQKELM